MVKTSDSRQVAMISSTARDLPTHRQEVMDACLRQGMFPSMMEHLPASDADAIAESLKLVEEANLYLGIFAHRYGYVPKGHSTSITEMEYERAAELKLPRLIFLMHEDHPVKAADVEKGEGAIKLEALKQRLGEEQVVNFFDSPADLRAKVIDSLSSYRERDLTALHYVRDIPEPPEPYIAHPYTLLQTRSLIGRQEELALMNNWVADRGAEVSQSHVLNIVAIGGMGKSALTWKWFNDDAEDAMSPLVGRMWWSFYESDAHFDNFVVRALAYVTGKTQDEVRNIPPPERELQLLAVLNQQPFLFVLDGLERILIAYARLDAARMADYELNRQTANVVADKSGLPKGAADSFTGNRQLRKTIDPRVGSFLRKLAGVRASRILVSTRLYPADLQTPAGKTIPGSAAHFLSGLEDEDAMALWRASDVSGTPEELLPVFRTFDKHPLLIQALASEVANYRRAPGDFERWRVDHSGFNPFGLVEAQSHVMTYAMQGLDGAALQVLRTVAAFRMPATYDTLTALLVGEGKLFAEENSLVASLTELEDRGLMGWDRRANRYDLHPIVRGVVWGNLAEGDRRGIYGVLQTHFEALPFADPVKVETLEDLTPAIELYDKLVGLERYDDAWSLFDGRISTGMMDRLHSTRQMVELLTMLFPEGIDEPSRLGEKKTGR